MSQKITAPEKKPVSQKNLTSQGIRHHRETLERLTNKKIPVSQMQRLLGISGNSYYNELEKPQWKHGREKAPRSMLAMFNIIDQYARQMHRLPLARAHGFDEPPSSAHKNPVSQGGAAPIGHADMAAMRLAMAAELGRKVTQTEVARLLGTSLQYYTCLEHAAHANSPGKIPTRYQAAMLILNEFVTTLHRMPRPPEN